jgi:uroporphyrinogen-III synthase
MSRDLEGKKILITRPEDQYQEWAAHLSAAGAVPVAFPLIKIKPVTRSREIQRVQQNIMDYDWVILTSTNAAKYFFVMLDADTFKIFRASIAAVGSKTAFYIAKQGIKVDFIPDVFTGASLARSIPDIAWKKVLLPRTNVADNELSEILRQRGAYVDEVVVYKTEKVSAGRKHLQELINEGTDVITFASPSAVEAYKEMLVDKKDALLACIGPVTAEKAIELGMTPDIVATTYTAEGLTDAMRDYYNKMKLEI